MARLGFVGLGNIGGAVAAHLVTDGHEVTVTDLDGERARAVAGAIPVDSVAEVAAAADITFTSLPSPAAVAAVAGEWAGAAAPGAVLVDLSTTAPAGNQEIAAALAERGLHFVEAPLTGGAAGARDRSLVFMVGGEPDPVARVAPLLDELGRATFHLGPVGTGTTMKLVNSLLAFACTWASLEALALAVAGGVDVRRAVEVVRTGGATNFFVDRAVDGIDQRGRPVDFALALAAKDAHLVREVAAAHGVSGAVAAALVEVLDDVVGRGLGDRDWSDLVLAAEQRSGVTLSMAPGREGRVGRVPIEEGYFTVPSDPDERPRLLGSRCTACGEVFFPRRLVCARCLHEGCDDVELGPTGRLWTWTYVRVPLFAKKDGSVSAYGVGQVDLPEGPRVQAILLGGPDDFAIGMEVELDVEVLRTDGDGNDVVIHRFRPTAVGP